MKRRYTNLDNLFSVSSYYQSINPFYGSTYFLTDSSFSTAIYPTRLIKVAFTNLSNLLNGKRIIGGKITFAFEAFAVPIVFTLKDGNSNVIDQIDTSSNLSTMKTVGGVTFLTFDISTFAIDNNENELYLESNSQIILKLYGFNYLDSQNANLETPIEYIQINEFYNVGKKDNTTFVDYDLGNAGLASVSLVNGNLLFAAPTLVGNLAKTSLNISLCYNSLRGSNLTSGYGFRLTTDWCFETISSKLILLTDSTGQDLLYEKISNSIKDALQINTNNQVFYCVEDKSFIEILDTNLYKYHSPSKLEMVFSVNSGVVAISSTSFDDGTNLIYNYYEGSSLLKEVETPDDVISLEYTDGVLTKLISTKKYIETVLEYTNGFLTLANTYRKKYIPFTNNQISSELIRSIRLTYDSTSGLLISADNMLEHRRLQFIYDDGKVIKIKESPFDEEFNIHIIRETNLQYGENITTLTMPSNHQIYHCFNAEQQKIYVMDDMGKVVNYNYLFSNKSIENLLLNLSENTSFINDFNLITNGSFECSPVNSGWAIPNTLTYERHDDSVYGDYCLHLFNDTSIENSMEQDIEALESDTYVFYGKFKLLDTNATNYLAKIIIQYDEITYIWVPNGDSSGAYTLQETIIPRTIIQTANLSGSSGVWHSFEINNLTIPAEASVKVEVIIPAHGKLCIDDFALVKSNKIGTNNFIRNYSFETIDSQANVPYAWNIAGSGISLIDVSQQNNLVPGTNVFHQKLLRCLSSSNHTQKTIQQHIFISGSAGDQLSIGAWIKGNLTVNEQVKVVAKVHKFGGSLTDLEEFAFTSLPDLNVWQPVGGNFTTNIAYDYIDIIIDVFSYHEVIIDNVQLYKTTFGNNYTYSNKGQLLSEVNGKRSLRLSLDENDKNGAVIGKNGEFLLYQYDNQNREQNVYDSNGNKIHNEYDDDSVTKTLSHKSVKIVTSSESLNGLTTYTDELGFTSKKVYDEFGNLVTSIDNNGNVIRRIYDEQFRPVTIERKTPLETLGKLQIEYTDLNKPSSIIVSDGTTYHFSYDDWGRRTSTSLNNIQIETLTYSSPLQYDQPVIVGKQINSDSLYNYTISYLNGNPSHIILNNSEIFTLKYDSLSRLVEWDDIRNDIKGFINYDFAGHIISETIDNGFSYRFEYDDLDNSQSKHIRLFDNEVFYSFLRDYEFNESSLANYAFDLANITNNDVILGSLGIQGLFGLQTNSSQDLISTDAITNYDVLNFMLKAPIKYDLSSLNAKKMTSGFLKSPKYQESFLITTTKAISGWFYFNNNCLNKTIFAFEHSSSIKTKLKIINNTQLELTAGSVTKTIIYESGLFNKWLMITLNLYGPSAFEADYAKLFINNEEIDTIHLVAADLYDLDKFILGGENVQDSTPNMKVLYICIGENIFSQDLIDRIYKSSYIRVTNGNSSRHQGTEIFISNNNNYEYFPLNGTYTSIRGNKPLYVGQQKSAFIDESNFFSWDVENKTQVYNSFDSAYFLNETEGSSLSYLISTKNNTFSFSVEYKMVDLTSMEKRILFALSDESTNAERINFYFENGYLKLKYCISNNETIVSIVQTPQCNQWHKLTIKCINGTLSIYGDSNTLLTTFSGVQLNNDDLILYLGCSNLLDKQLNGYLKNLFLCVSNYDLFDALPNICSCLDTLDSFGRVTQKVFSNVTKTYSYAAPKDDEGDPLPNRTSFRIYSESDSLNNAISYEYDGNGNVINIIKNNNETSFDYDMADRLIKVEDDDCIKEYSYDSNGNIINIKTTINNVITDRVFTYDNNGKRLLSIIEGNNQIAYQYPNNSFYPTRIGNLLLSWEGKLLKEIDNGEDVFQYEYDYRNKRISKSTIDSVTHYYYDKDKLVAERTGNDITYYHYDENMSAVGFSVSSNGGFETYFYLKDCLGIIHSIVNSSGQIVATYEYDAFGLLLSTSGNSNILSKNHIIYKDYFYDEETGFYILGSRYYYPYSCRFISPDDVDYLLANLLDYTQFNLFSYCNNNPLILSDESGHFVLFVTLAFSLLMPVMLTASLIAPALGTTIINTSVVAVSTAIAAIGALEVFGVIVGIADSIKKNKDFVDSIFNALHAILNIYQIIGETTAIGIGLGFSSLFNISTMKNWCLSYFNEVLPIELRRLVEDHYAGLTLLSGLIQSALTNPLAVVAAFCVNWVFGIVVGIIDTAYSLTLLISSNNNYEHNKVVWNNYLYLYDDTNPNRENWPIANPFAEKDYHFIDLIPFIDNIKIWINGQLENEFETIKCGFSTIEKSGCGIIAAFNALQFVQGVDLSFFPDIIMDFEQKNLLFEAIGALPNEIENYLQEKIPANLGNVLSFTSKSDFFLAYDNCLNEKAVLSCHLNKPFMSGVENTYIFEDYLRMHYTFACKYLGNNYYYSINDLGSFYNKQLTEYWDDTTATYYRGFVYAMLIKKN